MPPTLEFEHHWLAAGHRCIAGVDEAGRGCWAGPVVAAAVILGPAALADPGQLAGVDDSKLLTAVAREQGLSRVQATATGIGIGIVPAFLIDAYGIVPATKLAMTIAILNLPQIPTVLLIDAVSLPELGLPQQALIKGDARVLSIAAASLVAKVTRDRIMATAEQAYPGYGFAAHKGYGTAVHQHALAQLGPCELHRRSFAPVLAALSDS